jgi:hypothetical protein
MIAAWQVYVRSQNEWRENRYAGYRVVSIDLTGFWRPRLQGWVGKHYHSLSGKALPAVVLGVLAVSGRIHGKRIPLLQAIVRCQPEQSEAAFRVELLKQAADQSLPGDANVMDAGFKISEIQAAGLDGYVVRMQANCTARRNHLPAYKGRGARPKYGELVRPLVRKHNKRILAASRPDQSTTFEYEGRTICVSFWHELVMRDRVVSSDTRTFSLYVYRDPHYTNPLVLATDLSISAEAIYLIYRDRWTVEQPPLAAKQMIGLHRQFVSAPQACFRLPELALLAGSILTHVAAVLPPVPSGFWDRRPKATPGRLRRLLGRAIFPNLALLEPQLRKKDSVTDHLPKGINGHRRKKRAA